MSYAVAFALVCAFATNLGSAADTVNGFNAVANQDVLFITDKSALLDAAFTNVKNVSTLEFGANPLPNGLLADVTGQKVVLSPSLVITPEQIDRLAGVLVAELERTAVPA